MIKFSCDRIVIEVRDEVLKIFEQYRQGKDDLPEAGGVLHGKRLKNGSIIITDITTPQIGDIQKDYSLKTEKFINSFLMRNG